MACRSTRIRLISAQAATVVVRCRSCGSAEFRFRHAVKSHASQYQDPIGYAKYLDRQDADFLARRRQRTLDRLRQRPRAEGARLFDVGAGGGAFLAQARAAGFAVAGNEVSGPAIKACRERTGIDLHRGSQLRDLEAGSCDVVTMWCVVSHADDAEDLLAGALHLLSDDGVLYFHTPRWCLIDTLAHALARVSHWRFRGPFDMRINDQHRRLYSTAGLVREVERVGFEIIELGPVTAFGVSFKTYFTRLGAPDFLATVLAAASRILDQGHLLPRNTLEVYARPSRPAAAA